MSFSLTVQPDDTYVGMQFSFAKSLWPNIWEITCPCGVTASYPLNGLPEVDTPHPCGQPNHWTVRFVEIEPPVAAEPIAKDCEVPR